jgi:uncharacterized protein YfiM (DUF2279 family)
MRRMAARHSGADSRARTRRRLACALVASILAGAPGDLAPRAAADPLFLSTADQGSWFAADKELHFAGSLAIGASLRVEGRSPVEALAGTLCVGLLKETYDATLKPRRLKRGASVKDLVVDFAGALAGVLLLGALDR